MYRSKTPAIYGDRADFHGLSELTLDDKCKDTVISAPKETCEDESRWCPLSYRGSAFPDKDAVNKIYESTTDGSPARRLLVDVYAVHGKSCWWGFSASSNLRGGFLFDLTKGLTNVREVPAYKRKALATRSLEAKRPSAVGSIARTWPGLLQWSQASRPSTGVYSSTAGRAEKAMARTRTTL